MRELGTASATEHVGLAPDVIAHADLLFACGPEMKRLYEAVPGSKRGGYASDSLALAPLVVAALRAGDAVLVKGSLGSRMGVVINALPVRAETEEPD
jgi:UDP-N-acetylmuramoyl-tripeptide--D-alanyl-D-alanine ligase